MAENPLPHVADLAALRGEMIENAKLLAMPINFGELVEAGVLGPVKGGWYELLRPDLLPKHASQQATSMKQQLKRGQSRTFLKFGKRNATAAKIYQRLTGKAFKAG